MADSCEVRLGEGGGGREERLRYGFGRGQKLKGRKLVDAVYKTGKKRVGHPLVVYGVRRDDEGASRVGISIGKRCGGAVARNGIKRRIREAYRLLQHELPTGWDWLVVVKPHKRVGMGVYQERLRGLMTGGAGAAKHERPTTNDRR